MKTAFGSTLVFQIVVFFIIVFAGYICISINQAKAFNVKNEIVKAIERNAPNFDGNTFRESINRITDNEGYRLEGNCNNLEPNGAWEAYERDGSRSGDSIGAFCIREIGATMAGGPAVYYKVTTFYQLEIPILQSLFQLKASGETKLIYNSSIGP